jgi:hypothetical protein
MPYSVTIKSPVMFVAWRGFSGGDLREITEKVGELRRVGAHPVAYLARIPAEHHVFSDEDKKVLLAFLNGILPFCVSIHHVIEGDGFLKSARLAFVTNLAHGTPRPRDFYVHATLEEGLRAMKALYGVDLRASASGGIPSERAGELAAKEAKEAKDPKDAKEAKEAKEAKGEPPRERRKEVRHETPQERASAVFRGAARIADVGRGPPRKGS